MFPGGIEKDQWHEMGQAKATAIATNFYDFIILSARQSKFKWLNLNL